ncbi:MAG TPA: HXXEE domain-containing protein [Longimicrobium sp.]|nr:HXXEE domain-containing protein [Longimicrobium sp.]
MTMRSPASVSMPSIDPPPRPASALHLSQRAALLLVPVLITVHNGEEALGMPRVLRSVPTGVPPVFVGMIPTYSQFLAALAIVTAAAWMIWALGPARRSGRGITALLLVQMVMLVNVASHVGAAVFLRGYAPGVVTALALNLPFSIYLFRRAIRERWISRQTLALLGAGAVLIHGPGLLGLMWIARRLPGAA